MPSKGEQLHIFFFPLMAPGHMIPVVDAAKLFAARGVRASIIITAANAPAVEASIRRTAEAGANVGTLVIEWPLSAVGLPENFSWIASPDMRMDFLVGTPALRPSFERLVKEHRPAAIVSDMFYPWTVDVAEEVGIPRLVFHATSFFTLCLEEKLALSTASQEGHVDNDDRFVVPRVPHRIELSETPVSDMKEFSPDFADVMIKINEAEGRSYGTVVNTFYELEPHYADHYRKVMGKKAWPIGPVSLCNTDPADYAVRGGKATVDQARCLTWLDSKAERSVLYVCFGSLCEFTKTQLQEIAGGLESAGCPFIWVTHGGRHDDPSGQWLPEGFEERVVESGIGLIMRGWAPQVLILNHVAVGGFLTHCGWNSSLESIAAGLPMLTWPMFADQFLNERLLVDVLKIGAGIGVKICTIWKEDRSAVKAEEIIAAVGGLMGASPYAEEMRGKARELKAAARRAMEEGGSSYVDLGHLIQELSDKQSVGSHG